VGREWNLSHWNGHNNIVNIASGLFLSYNLRNPVTGIIIEKTYIKITRTNFDRDK
jgi:hypothetical protein